VDSAGSLYVADTDDKRIRKVSNGVITTVAGIGTPGLQRRQRPGHQRPVVRPRLGVAVDSAGNVYIADAGITAVIRKVSKGVITTVAGNGTAGFSGDNGPAT
jgi:sugar lactone lactonase YvrE